MSDNAIEVRGLSKSYRDVKAVVDLNLTVERGGCHGFLGPNGAGKTTVIKSLLGLTTPDSGEVSILGGDLFRDRVEIMRRVGAVVEAPALFGDFTARENLLYLSRFSISAAGRTGFLSKTKIDDALATVGLSDVADRKVGTFSYGMKQRLGIAQALLPESELVFLDEPTNGLDPRGIMGVRTLIRRLSGEFGMTVFISSHLLAEVEQVCDHVTIIDKGRVVMDSTVEKLVAMEGAVEIGVDDAAAFKKLADAKGWKIVSSAGEGKARGDFVVEGEEKDIPEFCREIIGAGIGILKVSKRRHTLEEVFVELTEKTGTDSFAD